MPSYSDLSLVVSEEYTPGSHTFGAILDGAFVPLFAVKSGHVDALVGAVNDDDQHVSDGGAKGLDSLRSSVTQLSSQVSALKSDVHTMRSQSTSTSDAASQSGTSGDRLDVTPKSE